LLALPVMATLPGVGQVFQVFGTAALLIVMALWFASGAVQQRTLACAEVAGG
jgi:hypothetical protein